MRLMIFLLSISLCHSSAYASNPADTFNDLYTAEWEFRLQEYPELASALGHRKQAKHLTQVSPSDQTRRYEYYLALNDKLDKLDCATLPRADCINYRIFKRQVNNAIADYQVKAYLLPFNSDWGFYLSWARLPVDTEFNQPRDYQDYLSRLRAMPAVMDDYIELMRSGLAQGITQPKVIMRGRDTAIAAQVVTDPTNSDFYQPFRSLGGNHQELKKQAQEVIATAVIPAYQKLLDFIRNEYTKRARNTIGAALMPGGKAFYRAQVQRYATVDLTPDRIHQIGLGEVARIRAEMEDIIKTTGFQGDFPEFLAFLRNDPQFYASNAKQLLAEASYFAKKVDGVLPKFFTRLPRQPYGVAPVPEDIAPFYTAGRYVGAAADATRGGYYWVNTYALESRPLYALPALTLHEAAPGHHLQGALALEQTDHPPFRRNDYISAYGEGWALYAEKLGVEMGIYETPYEHFGRLTYEMWRACRLVIDTGIHWMGWSRKQAIEYLADNTALSKHEINTEIDRYISWPGQAVSYKLGEYTIWQLRGEAENTLGEDFDLRGFHDHILALGSVPLDVLEDEVRHWIKQQKKIP